MSGGERCPGSLLAPTEYSLSPGGKAVGRCAEDRCRGWVQLRKNRTVKAHLLPRGEHLEAA